MAAVDLQLGRALLRSAVAHALLAAVAIGSGYAWRTPKPAQQVMVTRLVRLGPSKSKDLLPQLSAAKAPTTPKAPAPDKAVKAANKPPEAKAAAAVPSASAEQAARSKSQSDTRAALQRLRQHAIGEVDGSVDGDADVAEQGDRYAAEIYRCVKANYVIEGIEAQAVVGKRALVLLFVQGDGRIASHRLVEGSGLVAFDQAVSRAVRKCGKVSPPPAAWRARLRKEGMEIEFKP